MSKAICLGLINSNTFCVMGSRSPAPWQRYSCSGTGTAAGSGKWQAPKLIEWGMSGLCLLVMGADMAPDVPSWWWAQMCDGVSPAPRQLQRYHHTAARRVGQQ